MNAITVATKYVRPSLCAYLLNREKVAYRESIKAIRNWLAAKLYTQRVVSSILHRVVYPERPVSVVLNIDVQIAET